MKDKLSLAQKVIVLVCTPLLFQIFFVGTLGMLLSQAERDRLEESHAKDVATQATLILQYIVEGGATIAIQEQARNYIKTDGLARRSNNAGVKAQKQFEVLKRIVRGYPEEEVAIGEIGKLQTNIQGCLERARDFNRAGNRLSEVMEYAKLHQLVTDFAELINNITETQRAIMNKNATAQHRARSLITLFLLIGVVFNIFLALSIAFYFHQGTTSRLQILMDNTRRLLKGQALNPPVGGTDEIAHLDKVFQEMAAGLEEAQRKERAITQNAKDVICSLDREGNFTKVNPACLTVWGYEPEELAGKSWRELVMEADRERTEAAIKKIVSGESCPPIENRVLRKDGKEVDILWSAHWSQADQSLFCVAHDISDRKEIERMKQEFVAMVSHDLRTPLTSIQMYFSLLGAGVYGSLNENGKDSLITADTSITRLINLVNDLLDAEKMESGKLQLNRTDISMGDVLENALLSVKGFADLQGVELDLIPHDSDICADGDRLVQVMVNLLANAVKFSPRGSKVTITAAEHTDCVEVKVTDRGRGIPQDHLTAVFDRFTQVRKGDSKKGRGSGLGLTICKSIVETHGGTIGVESEEGKGSTFWFKIPRSPELHPAGESIRAAS